MNLSPISFKGIYDIRFPQGTKQEVIDEKYQQIKDYLVKNNLAATADVEKKDYFSCTKVSKPVVEAGIRLGTTVDNPWVLCKLFDAIDKRLGQDYINKSKVEMVLDTQA